MDLLFAYAAGLLTLINPCVLPVLPIVLASAAQAHRLGPVALAGGMSLAFVVLGVAVTAFGQAIGLTPETLSAAGAVVMVAFGLVLLVPAFGRSFATATAGVSARADAGFDRLGSPATGGLAGQFGGGLLLGAVWSPCIGPTLGGAIALASQGQALGQATAIMAAFAAGVSTVMLVLATGFRAVLLRNRAAAAALAARARPVLGAAFALVGLAILLGLHHRAEAWALEVLPPWLIDLSVSL